MYLERVSLLIINPNALKYSIQDVKESKFKVLSSRLGGTKVLPFLIYNKTGILRRVPKEYIFCLSFCIKTNNS